MFITNLFPWQKMFDKPLHLSRGCGLRHQGIPLTCKHVKPTTGVKEQPLVEKLPTWRQGLQGDLARLILDPFQPSSTLTVGLSFAGRH